ncbi:MAG: hypothetical protein FWF67_00100 [Fibromonadales bacterium]|nr:hypothetical protein [Fibromonadales bacterium]
MRNKLTKITLAASIALAMAFTFSCSSDDDKSDNSGGNASTETCAGFTEGTTRLHQGKNKPQFCDERNGKKYVYETIVTGATAQTWMAENLNYNTSGSKCGVGGTNGARGTLSDANTPACDTYGRLYDWVTAMVLPSKCNSILSASDTDCAIKTPHQGICPTGWHIPTEAEWRQLADFVNNDPDKLKATSGWDEPGGEDTYGFSALAGGMGYNGAFFDVGKRGAWRLASDDGSSMAQNILIRLGDDLGGGNGSGKVNLLSIRCVKD